MTTTKRASKVKPPKRVDQRKTTSTRISPEIRAQLEGAATQSGRSLAQEIEFRLERAFLEEGALGGPQFYSLFQALAGAAKLIEAKTGQSCFKDAQTAYAVDHAWRFLMWQFMPKLPVKKAMSDLDQMDPGLPPEYPREKSPVLLLGAKDVDILDTQEWKDAVRETEKFRAAQQEWQNKAKAHRASVRAIVAHLHELQSQGLEAAQRFLPKKVATDEQ